jgi:transcriptional regulator with XRE-family HTH domain
MTVEQNQNSLGAYLRNRRAKVQGLGIEESVSRRRTPGLRREEVAQRADVSATWYTWLEQGRGGAPSAEVLDRLSKALELNDIEREHLYYLAQSRPPESHGISIRSITPQLQRTLDAMVFSPAYIKNHAWDVIAWNSAMSSVLFDYGTLPLEKRNILRQIFLYPKIRDMNTQWEKVASAAVAVFRGDMLKAGANAYASDLYEELSLSSPDFRRMWADQNVLANGDGVKHFDHPELGLISLEYSSFAIDSHPHLTLVISNPISDIDREKVRSLVERL